MTVPLFELSVPIKTLGESEVRGAFQRIETAGKKAGETLANSARTGVQAATKEFGKLSPQMAQALVNAKGNVDRAGRELAQTLTASLRREFVRTQAEIREEVARGLLNPAQAQQKGREAAQAFNRGVLQIISQQGAAGNLAGRQGGALFVNLSNQLRTVDRAATQAGRGGIRTLAGNMAQLAAMELGLRSGLGTTISVLGTMALGSALTLGVTAGLAAIAFGFSKIKQRADEAREATKKAAEGFQSSVEELKALRAEQMPLETAQKNVTKALQDQTNAADRQEQAQKRVEAVTRRAAIAEAALKAASRATGPAASGAAVAAGIALAKARNDLKIATDEATQAEQAKAEADTRAVVAQARLTAAEKDAAEEEKRRLKELEEAAQQLVRAHREHVEALVQLSQAGIATAQDLDELTAVERALESQTKKGTAVARAQAQALLETVRAARLARLEGALRLNQLEPRLSRTTPPDLRLRRFKRPSREEEIERLQEQGFVTEFPTVDMGARYEKFLDTLPAGTRDLLGFKESLDQTVASMASMPSVLQLGADAWVGFWEALGAGEGIGASIQKMFSGVAKYFAQYFAAKALAAAAEALLPPPLGNPAAAGAIPIFLAASAAFAALAGATGGGRGGARSGGGGSRRLDTSPIVETTSTVPRLRGVEFGADAARVKPIQPVTFNGTFYGTDRDPKVHDWFAKNIAAAQRRGLSR